jgi:hypothetical protein
MYLQHSVQILLLKFNFFLFFSFFSINVILIINFENALVGTGNGIVDFGKKENKEKKIEINERMKNKGLSKVQ